MSASSKPRNNAEQNHSLHTGCRKCSLNAGGIGRSNETRLHDKQNLVANCHPLDVALGITIDNMACETSMPCVEHASTLWDECAPALQRRKEEGEKLLGGSGRPTIWAYVTPHGKLLASRLGCLVFPLFFTTSQLHI